MANIWTVNALKNWLTKEENKQDAITSQMIRDLIAEDAPRSRKKQQMYNRYKGEDLPIESKTSKAHRPNNQLAHDFRGEIIDQKVGYSFGQPVTYKFDKSDMEDAEAEKALTFIDNFLYINSMADSDIQCSKYFSVCGDAARLLYIDKTAERNIRVLNLRPWEVIIVRDAILDQVVFAMRYWKMEEVVDGKRREYHTIEWYDDSYVYYYDEVRKGSYELQDKEAHGFKQVPIIDFPNKHEKLGDFEKVESLIDMYDYIQSFNGDELEAFRNAYLVFKNQKVTKEYMDKVAETGGITLNADGEAAWLIKDLKPEFVEKFLIRLKSDIYRFAKAVDMSDEKFSGQGQTGESRKWKLKSLADDGIMKEGSFRKASQDMFRAIGEISKFISVDIVNRIELVFTENLPQDLKYQAETTQILKGNVSEITRLSQLSFVEDPEAELDVMREEREENMEFMESQFNSNNPDDESQNQDPNQNKNEDED